MQRPLAIAIISGLAVQMPFALLIRPATFFALEYDGGRAERRPRPKLPPMFGPLCLPSSTGGQANERRAPTLLLAYAARSHRGAWLLAARATAEVESVPGATVKRIDTTVRRGDDDGRFM